MKLGRLPAASITGPKARAVIARRHDSLLFPSGASPLRYRIVDVFTERHFEGNPLCVVLSSTGWTLVLARALVGSIGALAFILAFLWIA